MHKECQQRGAEPSFHVDYVVDNEDAGDEVRNITHQDIRSYDDLNDGESEVCWVVEPGNKPGLVQLCMFASDGDDGDQIFIHNLSAESCYQMSDMFRLIAMNAEAAWQQAEDERRDAEAQKLAEDVEIARMHQPLPFESESDESCSVCGGPMSENHAICLAFLKTGKL